MVPDLYTLENMALGHRQQLLREAEHEQMLGELTTHSSHWMCYVTARLGTFLIALGTRLIPSRQQSDVPRFGQLN
jgi:hypothetical protein